MTAAGSRCSTSSGAWRPSQRDEPLLRRRLRDQAHVAEPAPGLSDDRRDPDALHAARFVRDIGHPAAVRRELPDPRLRGIITSIESSRPRSNTLIVPFSSGRIRSLLRAPFDGFRNPLVTLPGEVALKSMKRSS
jgi:hypothetical protein